MIVNIYQKGDENPLTKCFFKLVPVVFSDFTVDVTTGVVELSNVVK